MAALLFPIIPLLIIVWVIVHLLLRFVRSDTLEHDMNNLWSHFHLSEKDFQIKKNKY